MANRIYVICMIIIPHVFVQVWDLTTSTSTSRVSVKTAFKMNLSMEGQKTCVFLCELEVYWSFALFSSSSVVTVLFLYGLT